MNMENFVYAKQRIKAITHKFCRVHLLTRRQRRGVLFTYFMFLRQFLERSCALAHALLS